MNHPIAQEVFDNIDLSNYTPCSYQELLTICRKLAKEIK